jgi:maltose O-acetyltransferase
MDTDFHDLAPSARPRWNTTGTAKPVSIGPNVWVCAGAMILKGVTIGANSVVGAGSVLSRDVPANAVAVGNPARVTKRFRAASGVRGRRAVCLKPEAVSKQ